MPGDVKQHRSGTVLYLELNAPERRNALSRTMLAALTQAVIDLPETATGVVLSGSGGVFSAGADFRELNGDSTDLEYDATVAAAADAIRRVAVPVIAAVEGPCVGAAVDLALGCDLRVAGQDGFVEIPALRLGLLYNPASVARWRSRVPDDTLRRLLLLGERLGADEAHRAGIMSHLVPCGEAVEHAAGLLEPVDDTAGDALRATKGLLQDLEHDEPDLRRWADTRRHLLDSPARQAAVAQARRTHVKDS